MLETFSGLDKDDAYSIPVTAFATTGKQVVFGIPLVELSDSFMVGLPALLYGNEDGVRGKELSSAPIIRMYKSNLSYSSPAPEANAYFYYKYLEEKKYKLLSFFTKERCEFLHSVSSKKPEASERAEEAVKAESSGKATAVEDDDDDEGLGIPTVWKSIPFNRKTRH
ncbi:MAG TPA: hypothetical protein VFM18_07690 [Methanosarcina sp.]|nr:hypothetical protein [Methanosarcina sp.]